MNECIEVNKTLIPESCFKIKENKYKKMNETYEQIKKNFEVFLDEGNFGKIRIKHNKNRYSFNINRIFKQFLFNSRNKVIDKNKNDNEKRFYNAKEIQKYKDKKMMLFKYLRARNKDKNINYFSDKKHSGNMSDRNDFYESIISNNKHNCNKNINNSSNANLSAFNRSSFINTLYKNKKGLSGQNINVRKKLFSKISGDKSFMHIGNVHNRVKPYSASTKNNSLNNINSENKKNVSSFEYDNIFDEDYIKKSFVSLKKKIKLSSIQSIINKLEKKGMYYKNNSYDLNSVKKFRVNKYMNPKILNYKGMNNTNKNKDFKRIIYDKFKKRNFSSTQKRIKSSLPSQITKRLNKTQDHLHKEYSK